MKSVFLWSLIISLGAFAADREPAATEESISLDDDSAYNVKIEPENKQVQVTQTAPGKSAQAPQQLKLRILRSKRKPIDVDLKAVEPANSPQRYIGRTPEWNGSYVGLELSFSFDGKSWKKGKRK